MGTAEELERTVRLKKLQRKELREEKVFMRKPILITHTYRCSACGSTDTQVYNSLIDGKAVEPVLPKGWRDYGQEGLLLPCTIF